MVDLNKRFSGILRIGLGHCVNQKESNRFSDLGYI